MPELTKALFYYSSLQTYFMPSSVVAGIKYDELTLTLRITYISGKIYDYLDVPHKVFKEMKMSGSKGTFLNKNIKGKYAFKRIN